MKRQYELTDPIKIKELPNKAHFAMYDLSKPIAGDRWVVRVCCAVKVSISQDLCDAFDEDLQLLSELRKSCNDTLILEILKERNFVDENVKDDVVSELMESIEHNVLDYMSIESFPRKLFQTRFAEFKKQHHIAQNTVMSPINDEDDEPADFSACFRD